MIVVRFLLRFILVPLAATTATCVAMLFVIAAHWNRFVALAEENPAPPDDAAFFVLLMAPALVMSAAVVAMLAPAAIGALIAEAFAIRSWMFHTANGGLSASLGWIMLAEVRRPYDIFNEPLIVAGAGIAAGFAYWAIAGWSAGFWKPVFDEGAKENRLSEERR
jgi:hypothetical protein